MVLLHVNSRPIPTHSKSTAVQMTQQQFREWLKAVDVNGDGLISGQELTEALRVLGINRAKLKAWFAVVRNDCNHNHGIDGEKEIKKFTEYAAKHWGIVVKA